jgi:Zn-dependent peptidase ImmA (M78 family)/transcriptional regulator with XRE-family HTH domain
MKSTIQQRIRERREAFRAPVSEMARLAGLSEGRWAEIEAGGAVSVADLGPICKALAVESGALLRGEEKDPRRSVARFRQATPLSNSSLLELRTLSLAAELGRIGGALYGLLGRSIPWSEVRQLRPVDLRKEPWRQGYSLGARVRRLLNVPAGPIFNLQKTLEVAGVHVATLRFSGPQIDAASLVEPEAMPILLLNRESPRIGQVLARRAAMSHELCHLLFDAGEGQIETRISLNEGDAIEDDPIEQRARAFAPAFLAPPDEVRSYFRAGGGKFTTEPEDRVLALAKRWGLSWLGAVWHAKNCELIPADTAQALAAARGPRLDWQAGFEEETTKVDLHEGLVATELTLGRIAILVVEALEEGEISEGRAREILDWG